MAFNKKAIMMNFLVTVILAIIIFAPACVFLSKFFRLSEQAENNFYDFVETVVKVQTGKLKQNHLLIIDEDTFIISYNANKKTQLCTAQNECGTFAYPSECQGKSCICLCQEFEGTGFKASASGSEDLVCTKKKCEQTPEIEFKDGLHIAGFYPAEMPPNFAGGYFRNGFVITRGTLEFSGFVFNFEQHRRIPFIILADGQGRVGLCSKEPCQFYERAP